EAHVRGDKIVIGQCAIYLSIGVQTMPHASPATEKSAAAEPERIRRLTTAPPLWLNSPLLFFVRGYHALHSESDEFYRGKPGAVDQLQPAAAGDGGHDHAPDLQILHRQSDQEGLFQQS
ncbi:hypothetical protein, partial [Pantoea graminicola]|uniref:hypothetical protein n=1 Tax=Pantoea sp. ARC607 TaxID=2027922 RepID=UPI001F3FDF3A